MTNETGNDGRDRESLLWAADCGAIRQRDGRKEKKLKKVGEKKRTERQRDREKDEA